MAVTRRGYIIGACFSSVISVVFIIISVSTDNWIESPATDDLSATASFVNYGLFGGELQLNNLATPTFNNLYMTCVVEFDACAVSCKTTKQAREDEVRALSQGRRTNPACVAITTIDDSVPQTEPSIIHSTFYITLLVIVFTQLLFAALATSLAILNVIKNPTEPILGLPGCLWCNAIAATLGTTVLLMFGIYWITSDLKTHLAFSYFSSGLFVPKPYLGYSYWIQLISVSCSVASVCLIELRRYLLEKDPPPPTIKVENHSDGTVFLY